MLQPQQISWQPILDGVELFIGTEWPGPYHLAMTTVRELRDDMEEAAFNARGYDKVDCMVSEVDAGDLIVLGGNAYQIKNLLTDPDAWVIEFDIGSWTDSGQPEMRLPGDLQVTVWRPVE